MKVKPTVKKAYHDSLLHMPIVNNESVINPKSGITKPVWNYKTNPSTSSNNPPTWQSP